MLRAPDPDPSLDAFRGGVAVLRRDGEISGHVATSVAMLWSPLSLTRRREWCVWLLVVWANGDRAGPLEEYAPWTYVREMQSSTFVWEEDDGHRGLYRVEWLPADERGLVLEGLRISPFQLPG
ncbi:MAG TPA: hypothetical protein PLZ93_05325 [Nocardioides sp.]|uniref:hypothetical protein n=1 Tax=uncultured Nocardioides sp. TaxID=198441 RepID=UPI00261FCB6A|nr:hypothetical protein [uncultured Nocardioides sp.]HRD61872.1 hypothetical protein [Nocardioides sp.]HRI95010.1 hypothetical protein [Nocardioides sp.]HRK44889.1 hypothetical protein [Nocardioides sp.]